MRKSHGRPFPLRHVCWSASMPAGLSDMMGHQEGFKWLPVLLQHDMGNLKQKIAAAGPHLGTGSLLGDAEDQNGTDEGLEDCCQLRKGLQQNSNYVSGVPNHGSIEQCKGAVTHTNKSKSQHRACGQQQPQEVLRTCPGCAAFSLSPSRHWQR